MNFLTYILLFIVGTCTLTFGVLGLLVNRFLKLLSPACKTIQPNFQAANNKTNNRNSKFSKKDFFNKQNVEDVRFEEVN
jgi:hypothetical protein